MSDVCTKSLARLSSVSWLELFIFGSLGQARLRLWKEGGQRVHMSAPQLGPSWG